MLSLCTIAKHKLNIDLNFLYYWLNDISHLPSDILDQVDSLVQQRCNSSALAMQLRLSCANPLKWLFYVKE